ncbi:MAG: DUF928 domain-containing protein [Cyanobacteria bacterium P01_F01_bin.53]
MFRLNLASTGLAAAGLMSVTLGIVPLGISLLTSTYPAQAAAFEPPPNQDAPSSTAGGGSRPAESACAWAPAGSPNSVTPPSTAIALAPQNFVSKSRLAQPTFWLHIPNTTANTDITALEISLFDHQLNGIAQGQQVLTGGSGLVPIQLPEGFTLSPGTTYYWSAAFICNPTQRTDDWVVGGWIQYRPLPFADQQTLKSLSLLAQAHQYITTGYWYDALATLMPLMQAPSPAPETQATWANLLTRANIDAEQIHTEIIHTEEDIGTEIINTETMGAR